MGLDIYFNPESLQPIKRVLVCGSFLKLIPSFWGLTSKNWNWNDNYLTNLLEGWSLRGNRFKLSTRHIRYLRSPNSSFLHSPLFGPSFFVTCVSVPSFLFCLTVNNSFVFRETIQMVHLYASFFTLYFITIPMYTSLLHFLCIPPSSLFLTIPRI